MKPAAQENDLLESDVAPGGRFAQMIYTSFDDGSGSGGGWQVKDSTAGMTPAEIELLTSRASTQFDVEPPLPRYPTPVDISNRPSRLMYSTVGGAAGYWHTCDAGVDGSGRPGNVFVHTVLDRNPGEASPDFRPIELWKSRGWLRPYGPAEVVATDLRFAKEPRPGNAVTRESVIKFLLESLSRQNHFEVLLDAIAAWFRGGPSVVLVVEDSDKASLWIGAATYFMSPGTARQLSFSTHDRAASLPTLVQRGLALIAVPMSDNASVVGDRRYVVLDTGADVAPGSQGGEPHRSSEGADIARVTPWSTMARTILGDSTSAIQTLILQDAIADEVGDRSLSPMWPLAMAAASLPDTASEAASIVYRHPPRHLHLSRRLAAEARRIRAAAPAPRADTEWENLNLAVEQNDDIALAVGHYVEAALRDDKWLFRSSPAPRIDPELVAASSEETNIALSEVLDVLLSTSEQSTESSDREVIAFRALRIADLLYSSIDLATFPPGVEMSWFEILKRVSVETLFDPVRGPAFVDSVGMISELLLKNVVRPLVASSPLMATSHFGLRLPRRVLDWLFEHYAVPDSIRTESLTPDAVLYAELVADVVLSPLSGSDERRAMLPLAELIIRGHLADNIGFDSDIRNELIRLAWNAQLSAESASRIIASFGDRTPSGILEYCLLFGERSSALVSVIDFAYEQRYAYPVTADTKLNHDQHAIVWSAVRAVTEWKSVDGLSDLLDPYFKSAMGAFPRIPNNGFPADLLINMSVLLAAAQARDLPWAMGVVAVHPAVPDFADSQMRSITLSVADLVSSRSISIDSVVALSVLEEIDGRSGGARSWHDCVVDELVASGRYGGPVDLPGIRDVLWNNVRVRGADEAERMFMAYRDIGAAWLDTHRISSTERRAPWLS